MKSLLWLASFFVLSGILGLFVSAGFLLLLTTARPAPTGVSNLGSSGVFMLLAAEAFLLPCVPVMAGAAALVRRRLGRLTGFTLGVIAVLTTAVYGVVVFSHIRGISVGGLFGIPQVLGAMLLGRLPFFRRKALDPSPLSRFRGLVGTYAVSVEPADSAAVAIGRRTPGERRQTLRRGRRPARWDPSFRELAPGPREVHGRARRKLFFGRGAVPILACFVGAIAGSVGAVALTKVHGHSPSEDQGPAEYTLFLMALLSLSLFRRSVLYVHERVRLVRLLRDGVVVEATRSKDALYDQRDAVMTVGDTSEGRVAVLTRLPTTTTTETQGLLVGENGDVVAWDLLPFIPIVDEAGSLTAA